MAPVAQSVHPDDRFGPLAPREKTPSRLGMEYLTWQTASLIASHEASIAVSSESIDNAMGEIQRVAYKQVYSRHAMSGGLGASRPGQVRSLGKLRLHTHDKEQLRAGCDASLARVAESGDVTWNAQMTSDNGQPVLHTPRSNQAGLKDRIVQNNEHMFSQVGCRAPVRGDRSHRAPRRGDVEHAAGSRTPAGA